MTAPIQLISLAVATVLPGICGYGIVRLLLGPGHHKTLYVAHAYLVGMLLLTLMAQLWDFAGIPLHFGLLAASLLVVAAPGWWLMARGAVDQPSVTTRRPSNSANWQFWVTLALGCMVAIHLVLLLQEVWLRPTFPWDAWRGWSPKAIQFFDQRSLSADHIQRDSDVDDARHRRNSPALAQPPLAICVYLAAACHLWAPAQ